jgi:hypothetical protein
MQRPGAGHRGTFVALTKAGGAAGFNEGCASRAAQAGHLLPSCFVVPIAESSFFAPNNSPAASSAMLEASCKKLVPPPFTVAFTVAFMTTGLSQGILDGKAVSRI